MPQSALGIYVHIPFCRAKCSYCAFVSQVCDPSVQHSYVAALCREIAAAGGDFSVPVDTVFFGGGTPTLLPATDLARILQALRTTFSLMDDAEISLEANPGTVGIFGYSYLEENANRLSGVAINGVAPTGASISSFKYPGSRALYIYVKNAHLKAIPGIRQFAAEYAKETTFGPRGYLLQYGLIASPDASRKRAAAFATTMTPMNAAGLK